MEVDPIVQTLQHERPKGNDHQYRRHAQPKFRTREEIECCIVFDQFQNTADRQVFWTFASIPEHDDRTGHEDGCEERCQNTKTQRDRKPTYGARTCKEQYRRSDKSRDVRIENRGQRLFVAQLNRAGSTFGSLHFFFDSFKDNNVRIHGHTDGQHDPRNTGKRERGPNHRQQT